MLGVGHIIEPHESLQPSCQRAYLSFLDWKAFRCGSKADQCVYYVLALGSPPVYFLLVVYG